MTITAERLRALLDYDPQTGIFTWKIVTSNRVKVGDVAGSKRLNGYCSVHLDGRAYLSHRLAWLYMTGNWPTHHVDHINGDPLDNRFANIREASDTQNKQNSRTRKDNRSGIKGAFFHKQTRKWASAIRLNGKSKYLGLFETAEDAHAAYCKAAKELYGEFARFV